jgi:hypothetical protein
MEAHVCGEKAKPGIRVKARDSARDIASTSLCVFVLLAK